MGEQLPLETLYRFVKTALPKVGGQRRYYSRPERLRDNFEARRCLAPRIPTVGEPVHGQVEFFEYHWSYLMTGNKLGDLVPTTVRLLMRWPGKVPRGLRGVWAVAWVLIALLAVGAVIIVRQVTVDDWTVAGLAAALVGEGLLAALAVRVVHALGGAVTKSFVDVVRYLDRSPRSYAVRRDIREGMVELLTALHEKGRYSRVVVVAHSLGGYIAYDALAYLWPGMCKLHAGPLETDPGKALRLEGLEGLEESARQVSEHPSEDLTATQQHELDKFRERQFGLWQSLRAQGNPWLITDFVTLGTPMYFADLLYTHNRDEFDRLVRTAQFPVCPPRAGSQTVEAPDLGVGRYGWPNQGRTVLNHSSPFAVVRWTNLFFPVRWGFFGDWFGGRLRPLFGTGVADLPILGNKPGRFAPGLAHSRYFSYPEENGSEDVATVLQDILALHLDEELKPSLDAPEPLPATDVTT